LKNIKSEFVSYLLNRFPNISSADAKTSPNRNELETLISENLLSPFVVELPAAILAQAQAFVQSVYFLRESDEYRQSLLAQAQARKLIDPGNKSILMSYDFHLDFEENLKLIEINTNAAFLAMADAMYATHKISQPISNFTMDEIRENILEELDLFGHPNTRPEVAIMDENPRGQRLFAEFLVYQEWMKEWGFQPAIKDLHEISGKEDFIYNRLTDFYLEEPKSEKLKKLYLECKVCFSPNPYEYFLLADKQRMIEWSKLQNRPLILKHLNLSQELTSQNSEEIWADRKRFFFKPLRSFGAKQSFRGSSISRKAFDELIGQNIIAQEFVPAPERTFETGEGPQGFKFDLRFYAYKERVQSVVARLYQGQVTNLRTPGGGFAPVIFK
jgi:hypothetical protein